MVRVTTLAAIIVVVGLFIAAIGVAFMYWPAAIVLAGLAIAAFGLIGVDTK